MVVLIMKINDKEIDGIILAQCGIKLILTFLKKEE